MGSNIETKLLSPNIIYLRPDSDATDLHSVLQKQSLAQKNKDIVAVELPFSNQNSYSLLEDSYKKLCSSLSVLRQFLSEDISDKPSYFVATNSSGTSASEKLNGSDDLAYLSLNDGWRRKVGDPDSIHFELDNSEKSHIGSPLKLHKIADLSCQAVTSTPSTLKEQSKVSRCQWQGLSRNNARQILSVFRKNKDKLSLPMIIVLCDGTDEKKTFFLGMHITKTRVKSFCVSWKEQRQALQQPKQHLGSHNFQMTGCYDIMERKDGFGFITMEANWSDPIGKEKPTKLLSTKFELSLAINVGCEESPVYNQYCELQKVKLLIRGMASREFPQMFSPDTPNTTAAQLQSLFAKLKDGRSDFTKHFESEGNVMTHGTFCTTKHLNIRPREDMDFTDLVWTITSQCLEYQNMICCLNLIFECLKKRQCPAYVFKDNPTTLAQYVRQSHTGNVHFPSLTGILPLQLMAEIGMEKMRKDFFSFYSENKLCTSTQLEEFFHILTRDGLDMSMSRSCNLDEASLKEFEALEKTLAKLHHCLEVVAFLDSFTENQNLSYVVGKILEVYQSEVSDETQMFTFPVTARQASSELKKAALSFVKRESSANGVSFVECLLSNIPYGISVPFEISEHTDVSSVSESSKNYFVLETEESLCNLS